MDYIVTQNTNEIRSNDIVVDSTFSGNIECVRIDHHVDNCMTNIDSIYRAFHNDIKFINPPERVITSALDTDSIISAAIIDMLLSGELKSINKELLNTNIFKILYSSCFWCDYNLGFDKFDDEINRIGELLDLYIRQELQINIGLSYREKTAVREQNQIFAKQIEKVKTLIKRGKIPLHILEFPREEVYKEIRLIAEKCIITEAPESKIMGYIRTPDNEHLLPRVYFGLFKQPLIGRITYLDNDELSILIGINPISLENWENIDLTKLAEILNRENVAFDFSGRKNVIRTRFSGNIDDLYKSLANINIEELYDNKELFTVYK